jgi:hypothetical protein
MPGDDWINGPAYQTTKAIRIRARPEQVWPWLVQIGRGRGGLYSIDWLDRVFGILDAPSADHILPEFQHLEPGDVIPMGRTGGWPVLHVNQHHCLALAGEDDGVRWSWVFGLYKQPDGTTRLVSRNRVRTAGLRSRLMAWAVDPAAFIMTRAMLVNLKRRAEQLAASDTAGSPRSQ